MKKKYVLLPFLVLTLILSAGISIINVKANKTLVAPNSEQFYMDIKSPIDIAVNKDFYIVAEKNSLHILNRATNEYSVLQIENTIHQLAINSLNVFYRSDLNIYSSPLENISETSFTKQIFIGNYFDVNEKHIICATNDASYIYLLNADKADSTKDNTEKKLPFVWLNEENSTWTVQYNDALNTFIKIKGQAKENGEEDLFKINNSGFFKNEEKLIECANFKSFSIYKNEIYLLEAANEGGKVLKYNTTTNTKENFEISSASSSDGRLNNANDIACFENTLYVADTLNKRVVIIGKDGKFIKNINLAFYPYYIEASKNSLMVVCSTDNTSNLGNKLLFIDLSPISQNLEPIISEKIPDITNIENYHFISVTKAENSYYIISNNNGSDAPIIVKIALNGSKISHKKIVNTLLPQKITSDINGNIYILFTDGNALFYSKDIFKDYSENSININGKEYAKFDEPEKILKINTDLEQNIFAITTDNKIIKISKNGAKEEFNVSSKYPNEKVKGFTTNYADSFSYILFNNIIVKDDSIKFETLNSISTASLNFLDEDKYEVITIKAGMNLFLFNFAELKEDSLTFPINNYIELEEDINFIKIGATTNHYIFTGKYTGLVLFDEKQVLPYENEIETDENFYGYINFKSNVYTYPTLNSNFTKFVLNKDCKVLITNKVSLKDLQVDFYKISVKENNIVSVGYLPCKLISINIIEDLPQNNFVYKYTKKKDNTFLFEDKEMSIFKLSIPTYTKIKILNEQDNICLVEFEHEGNIVNGYLYSKDIYVKGENNLKNGIIIAIVLLSLSVTSLFILFKKK